MNLDAHLRGVFVKILIDEVIAADRNVNNYTGISLSVGNHMILAEGGSGDAKQKA